VDLVFALCDSKPFCSEAEGFQAHEVRKGLIVGAFVLGLVVEGELFLVEDGSVGGEESTGFSDCT